MAAYAALASLMNVVETVQHHPRPPIFLDKRQIDSLSEKVCFLQDFLENFSPAGSDVSQAHLEVQITEAAHAAEDVVESLVVDQILARAAGNEDKGSDTVFFQDLQKAIEQMDFIKKWVIKIKEKRGVQHLGPTNSIHTGVSTRPRTRNITMVGFDESLIEIMERLTNQLSAREILPVVGMGGIGKTTLARNVYDNPLIVQHFHLRAWVTVSQEYRVRDILLQALFCVRRSGSDENLGKFCDGMSHISEAAIGGQLYKSLFEMTYLVVMDDIWTIEAWEKVKMFFPDNSNGSRIMITTRISSVAVRLGFSEFKMNFLEEDKSWNLLCKIVFAEECCPLELEESGKKIAKNCKGLPLSIVVVGGLLAHSDKTREHWEYVAENLRSIVNLKDEERCLKILSLSYDHLPVHLKSCFLYIGVFPEDSEIHVTQLINSWIAEGFLKPIREKTLEQVAKEYLKDLVDRNLILVHKLGSRGQIRSCNIHDLLRDLCLREIQKEKFICVRRRHNLEAMCSERRVSIHPDLSEKQRFLVEILNIFPPNSITRSLTLNCRLFLPTHSFRLLRVLKALFVAENKKNVYSFADIFQLVNLRYLAFRDDWNVNSVFPSSIHLLWNLQTLIVKGMLGEKAIAPSEIWEMSQLRHLEFDGIFLTNPPTGEPSEGEDNLILRNLQTLMGVRDFSEDVTKRIPNIKKLQVWYFSDQELSDPKCYLMNLGCLSTLESLQCIFPSQYNPSLRIQLLPNLDFPLSLKKLNLSGCNLGWVDMTLIGSLPHLEVLKLRFWSFNGPDWDPVEGEFVCLKYLEIIFANLVNWTADSTHFPRLEQLFLVRLDDLQEIPLDIGEIPTLRSIELKFCSDSAVISAKNILQEQEDLGNEDLQVRVHLSHKISELEGFTSNNFQVYCRD